MGERSPILDYAPPDAGHRVRRIVLRVLEPVGLLAILFVLTFLSLLVVFAIDGPPEEIHYLGHRPQYSIFISKDVLEIYRDTAHLLSVPLTPIISGAWGFGIYAWQRRRTGNVPRNKNRAYAWEKEERSGGPPRTGGGGEET